MAKEILKYFEIDKDDTIICIHNDEPNSDNPNIIIAAEVPEPEGLIGLPSSYLGKPVSDRGEARADLDPISNDTCRQMFLKARSLHLDLLTLDVLGARSTQEYLDKEAALGQISTDYSREGCIIPK